MKKVKLGDFYLLFFIFRGILAAKREYNYRRLFMYGLKEELNI